MRKGTARRVRLAAAVGLLGMTTMVGCGEEAVASTCEKFGSVRVQDGGYIVQNNVWGSDVQQCISATTSGFSITSGNHRNATNGAPAAYPSIFSGCHYNNCTAGSPFPAQLSSLPTVTSTVNITTAPGEWNASYDLWFDPTARRDGQNTGAEIMVWVNHQGPPQPVGSPVGTVTINGAPWTVWFGNIGWNVISYVRQQPDTAFNGSLTAFAEDAVGRGYMQRSWYLTSVQFGFEPWVGGAGLGASGFTVGLG